MTEDAKTGPRSCPRCGRPFICRNDDILNCQCVTVILLPQDRAYIAERYDCCLCADCLRALATERRKALSGSADIDDLVRRMLDQGSTVTEADFRAVLADTLKACQSLLLEGRRVNFGGLCDLYPRLCGKFAGPAESCSTFT